MDGNQKDQILDTQQEKENSDMYCSYFQLCGPCSLIKKTKSATYICKLCDDEFLCEECSSQHRAQKFTKGHALLPFDSRDGPTKTSLLCEPKSVPTVTEAAALDPTDSKKPGKPTPTEIKSNKVHLSWTQPTQFGEKDYFQVSLKENIPDSRWKTYRDDFTKSTGVLVNLNTDTQYVFQVRVVYADMEGPFSDESDVVHTPRSAASEMVSLSVRNIDKNLVPARYALPLEEIKQARNEKTGTRKFVVGNEQYRTPIEKTIMMVGQTGTGKSTLLDGIANYVLGVEWGDPFRFQLVREENETEKSHNKGLSHTEWMTCYTIHPPKGSRYPHTINIIDTPGFGDSRGIYRDREIVEQIRHLFLLEGQYVVKDIDAVCLVFNAHNSQLTAKESYIIQSILSLFGKNIKDNICSLITFAGGNDPPVNATLQKLDLPFGERFTFNNSSLFENNTNISPTSFAPIFWQTTLVGFETFFKHVNTLFKKSLQQTRDVLYERKRMEVTINNLQPKLYAALDLVKQIKHEMDILEKNKSIIAKNKNFQFVVTETRQVKRALPAGEYAINCTYCNFTCKRTSGTSNDTYGSAAKGYCVVCPNKCAWTQHANTPYLITYNTVEVRKTYEEMEKKYRVASVENITREQFLQQMREKLQKMMESINGLMDIVKKSNERLTEIALRPNPTNEAELIKQIIENEQFTKMIGYQGRVRALSELLERTRIADTAKQLTDELDTVGIIRNEKDIFLKGLQAIYNIFGMNIPLAGKHPLSFPS